MRRIISLLASMLFVAAAGAQDTELLEPRVAFSAWRVMSSGDLRMEGKYHYAPGKHRNELQVQGQQMTTILREDLDTIWNLMPAQRMYMELPIGDANDAGGSVGVEGSEVLESELLGSETVNGQSTTKYRVTVRTATGDTSSGLLWVTADMIPMKLDMTSDGTQVMIELSDVEVGPQPDELFEVPEGYQRFGLGAFAPGRNGGQPAAAASGDGPAADADGSTPASGGTEAGSTVLQEVAEEARQGAEEGAKQGVRDNVRRRIRGLFGD